MALGMRLRVEYRKKGVFRFISHLDWLNSLKRALRRSGIKVAYSGGKSPHMKISLGPPLPVGVEGEREYFDVELEVEMDPREFSFKLNSQLPEELKALRCELAPDFALMKFVNFSIYDLRLAEGLDLNFSEERGKLIKSLIRIERGYYRLFVSCDSSSPGIIKFLLSSGFSWSDILLLRRLGLWRLEKGVLFNPFGEVEKLDKYIDKR